MAGVELPREWIDLLGDSIQVLIRFTQSRDFTYTYRSYVEKRCFYYILDSFEVDWALRDGSKFGLQRETVVIECQ